MAERRDRHRVHARGPHRGREDARAAGPRPRRGSRPRARPPRTNPRSARQARALALFLPVLPARRRPPGRRRRRARALRRGVSRAARPGRRPARPRPARARGALRHHGRPHLPRRDAAGPALREASRPAALRRGRTPLPGGLGRASGRGGDRRPGAVGRASGHRGPGAAARRGPLLRHARAARAGLDRLRARTRSRCGRSAPTLAARARGGHRACTGPPACSRCSPRPRRLRAHRGTSRLSGVANYAVGTDNVDVEAATARGVAGGQAPPTCSPRPRPTSLWPSSWRPMRRLREAEDQVREAEWLAGSPSRLLGHDLHRANVLVVGTGRIGTAVARRLRGLWDVRAHRRPRRRARARF